MTPKPQDPRIHGSYCAQTLYVHLRAPAAGERDCGVPRSLFCRFKTLVSFPEAAAFAWLDQADLGLSRRPRPSPLDGCSASHATCSTRGAAWRRTERERVSRESTRSAADPHGTAPRRELRTRSQHPKPFTCVTLAAHYDTAAGRGALTKSPGEVRCQSFVYLYSQTPCLCLKWFLVSFKCSNRHTWPWKTLTWGE